MIFIFALSTFFLPALTAGFSCYHCINTPDVPSYILSVVTGVALNLPPIASPLCDSPFNVTHYYTGVVQMGDAVRVKCNTTCVKLKWSLLLKNRDVTLFVRGCLNQVFKAKFLEKVTKRITRDQPIKDECESQKNGTVGTELCVCRSNFCNSGRNLNFSLTYLSVVIAIFSNLWYV